jgi:outer membrane protein assembly complex protein YaeT
VSPLFRSAFWLCVSVLAGCAATGSDPAAAGPEDLRFRGQRAFDAPRLRAVIQQEVGSLAELEYRRSAIDDAAFAVEQLYAAEGWPFCEVTYELSDSEELPRAELEILEGPRTVLDKLRLRGNRAYPDAELLEFLELPKDGNLRYFSRRAVDNAVRAISAWYFSEGFLDVLVSEPAVTYHDQDRRAEVAIEIVEGQRYSLRDVRIEGAPAGTEPDLKGLVDVAYTPPMIASVRRLVRESLGHHGYPDAQVQVAEERGEGGAVVLRVDVVPGPVVTIGGVRIEGNDKTRSARIRGALALEPGSRYDVELERASFRKLYEMGLFTTVRLSLDGEGTQRDLLVEVLEAPSTELYVEPGYGSYELGRLGLGWREINLFGTGRILNLDGSLSWFARRTKVDLTDPRLFDSDVSGNLSVFYDWRREPSFTDEEIGTGLTFSRSLSEHVRASLGYQYRNTNVLAVEVLGPEVQEALSDVGVSSIVTSLVRDTRDQLFAPRSGSITRPTLEFATSGLGSEIDFLRANLRHSQFLTLGDSTVLGLSFRGGVIAPIAGTDTIPLQERYFNGGESSVRSFGENELGARDAGGEPIGGEAYTVLSAELRQHLACHLEGALFLDSGNLHADYADFLTFDDMRHAVGFGLRYMLPIGPLRLDVGFNPDPKAEEDDFAIHFSVGMAF